MNIAKKAAETASALAEVIRNNAVSLEHFQVGYIKYAQQGSTHQLMLVPDTKSIKLMKLANNEPLTEELLLSEEDNWESQLSNFTGHSCRVQEIETTFVSKSEPKLHNNSGLEVNFENLAW